MDNVFAILGSDDALIKKEADAVVQRVAGSDADEFTLDVCEASDSVSPLDALVQAVNSIQTPAFMGMTKTVWLKNFPFDQEGTKSSKDALNVNLRLLSALIEKGIPDDVNFVMSGSGSDSRKSFFKLCKKVAAKNMQILDQPKITDRDWQEKVKRIIQNSAREKGLNLANDTIEHLMSVFGVNTASIENELEKIFCFCGEKSPITKADIYEICHGDREAEFYAFGSALGARDLNTALLSLKRLFVNGKDESSIAMGVLAQTANTFRQMLQVKLFMGITRTNPYTIVNTVKSPPAALKARLMATCPDVFKGNPFAMKFKAQDADKYSGKEIVKAIHLITNAYKKAVSSGCSRQLLLEHIALQIVQK